MRVERAVSRVGLRGSVDYESLAKDVLAPALEEASDALEKAMLLNAATKDLGVLSDVHAAHNRAAAALRVAGRS